MSMLDYSAMVVTERDELAWLFNLRGEGKSTNEVGGQIITLTIIADPIDGASIATAQA
jgi:hypothetical protein